MAKRFLIQLILLFSPLAFNAQDITGYLKQVSINNPEIMAYQGLLEARRAEARTGLAPADPVVTYGYMPGSNEPAGTKKIWSVSQSFSYPTKYLYQKRISRNNIILAEEEYNMGKLQIMLETKLLLLDLIYYEKTLSVLMQRKVAYDKLQDAWKKMFDLGEATIVEFNKINLEVSSIRLLVNKTVSDIKIVNNRLLFMNGNINPPPEITSYPPTSEPDSIILIEEKIKFHPAFIIPEKEYAISAAEIKLNRTGSLPEFHIGYGAETTPGVTYAGPVAGISLPLWSNSNKVKAASAMADHKAAKRDAELLRLTSGVMNEYARMRALKKSLVEISDILKAGDNKKYLDIALSGKEISLTAYFSDLAVMYEVEDRILELEHEYKRSLAILQDHDLLKIE